MGQAADVMRRKSAAFNAHDPKEALAAFSSHIEKEVPGTSLRQSFCALDEASYYLDSVAEPWSVHLEVRLSGTVIEERLRRAVGMALARHPRARARVTMARQWWAKYEWEIIPVPDVD